MGSVRLCIFLVFIVTASWSYSPQGDPKFLDLHAQVEDRLDALASFANSFATSSTTSNGKPLARQCGASAGSLQETVRYLLITEFLYGNSGNQYIELVHGLWLAERFNATLVIPSYMAPAIKPFDLAAIHSQFCLVLEHEWLEIVDKVNAQNTQNTIERVELESEESFMFFKIFTGEQNHKRYPRFPALPQLSDALVAEMSLHFLRVTSLLWANIHRDIVKEALNIMHHRLNSSLQYVTVHKRSMEGGCSKVLASIIKGPDDLNASEIPWQSDAWRANIVDEHPICNYPAHFVQEIIQLYLTKIHDTSRSAKQIPIYIAWDGRGSIDDFRKEHEGNIVLASDVNSIYEETGLRMKNPLEISTMSMKLKVLDMLMALNSELFILNPRSTLSWQVYLVRSILKLPSVPNMTEKDFYCMEKSVYSDRAKFQQPFYTDDSSSSSADANKAEKSFSGMWVNWESVTTAVTDHLRANAQATANIARRKLRLRRAPARGRMWT